MTTREERERRYVALTLHVAAHERDPSYLFPMCFDRGVDYAAGDQREKARRRTDHICSIFRSIPVTSERNIPKLRQEMTRQHVMSTTKIGHFFLGIAQALPPGVEAEADAEAAHLPNEEERRASDEVNEQATVQRIAVSETETGPRGVGAGEQTVRAENRNNDGEATDDDDDLADMLNETWQPLLSEVVLEQIKSTAVPHGSRNIIGRGRSPRIVPARELTFRALLPFSPQSCRVVIFGQNPYPRQESAVGIACCDGAIQSWSQPLSPTLRNVVKSVMQYATGFNPKSSVPNLRASINRHNLPAPQQWFQSTIDQGVLWLNRSLTFESSDKQIQKEHAEFWRPIILKIVDIILQAKTSSAGDGGGVVFVLWGKEAQRIKKPITQLVRRNAGQVRFVEGPNPAVEKFLDTNTFDQINEQLIETGEDAVVWGMSHAQWMDRLSGRYTENPPPRTPALAAETSHQTTTTTTTTSLGKRKHVDGFGRDADRLARAQVEKAGAGDIACVVCLENKSNVCILECGHVCVCSKCISSIKKMRCPLCRRLIWRAVPVFMG